MEQDVVLGKRKIDSGDNRDIQKRGISLLVLQLANRLTTYLGTTLLDNAGLLQVVEKKSANVNC